MTALHTRLDGRLVSQVQERGQGSEVLKPHGAVAAATLARAGASQLGAGLGTRHVVAAIVVPVLPRECRLCFEEALRCKGKCE